MKNDLSLKERNELSKSPKGSLEIASQFTQALESEPQLQNPWVTWKQNPENLAEEIFRKRNQVLGGLLIGVKDVISTQEFPTGMGANQAWTNTNMGFDSRVVAIAKELGAVIAGKTKTSEFAVHKETDVINPKFPGYTAGTSSAGSAAAVANGTIDLALATQTAGSIARPASYCGVIGFKPTFGDWPRTGVLKTTDDFDTVGVIGREPTLIRDFYLATRLSGADHPILQVRRRGHEFTKLVMLVGEEFDSANEEILNLANDFYESMLLPFGLERLDPEEYLEFSNIREVHETIYRRDLAYYFKSEIDTDMVSTDFVNFIDLKKVPTLQEYQEAKFKLNSWKNYCQTRFQSTLVVTLAASTSAPLRDVGYEKDLNAAITAAGFPQLSIPAFLDSETRNVNISLSGTKGCDEEVLNVGIEIFGKSDSYFKES